MNTETFKAGVKAGKISVVLLATRDEYYSVRFSKWDKTKVVFSDGCRLEDHTRFSKNGEYVYTGLPVSCGAGNGNIRRYNFIYRIVKK